MAVTPDSEIRLLKCNLNLDNTNQLNFATKTAQYNYFNSLTKLVQNGCTYQRKDNYIRWPAHIDSIIEYNYVMYKNTHYNDKWFYAYITRMEYENDNCTKIYIKTDVFQTWQFDLTYMPSFIEREHVNDDTFGKHTIPEDLETGEYISCDLQPSFSNLGDMVYVVGLTEIYTSLGSYTRTNSTIPVGLYYYGFTELQGAEKLISDLDGAGKGDAINCIFVAPKSFFSDWNDVSGYGGQVSTHSNYNYTATLNITHVNYLGKNYTPKNNKLLCYPYSYLQVSNSSGQVINYYWELFHLVNLEETNYQFYINGTLTPSCRIKAYPLNYKNMIQDFDDSITFGKLPIGAYTNDTYINWLTQNGVNIGVNLVSATTQVIGGALMMTTGAGSVAGAGSIAAGATNIAQTLGSVYQHSLIPDSVSGNVNCGDVNYVMGLSDLMFKRISIKNEYAKIIDDYFSMYGYKVNTVKTPNITGRSNWNFVKMINPNLEASIPQEDLQEIKSMFSAGLTIWHTTQYFLDYSRTNSII